MQSDSVLFYLHCCFHGKRCFLSAVHANFPREFYILVHVDLDDFALEQSRIKVLFSWTCISVLGMAWRQSANFVLCSGIESYVINWSRLS